MVQPFLPNEADAFNADQAEPDSVDFEILLLGYERTGVVSGCAVTESSPAAQTVDVAAGTVLLTGNQITVAVQADVAVTAADGTNPRFDLITANSSGTVVITAGSAAAQPVFPAIPATSVPLATLYIPTSDNTHADNQINDKRVFVDRSGAIEVAGSLTLDNTHSIVNVESTATFRTVTLPDNAAFTGKEYLIRRDGANTVFVNRAGTDTFSDGSTVKDLRYDGAELHIISIGDGEWKIRDTTYEAATRYVSVAGDDDNDGLDWKTPFRTVTKAFAALAAFNPDGMSHGRIRIANGAYTTETFPLLLTDALIIEGETGVGFGATNEPGVRLKMPDTTNVNMFEMDPLIASSKFMHNFRMEHLIFDGNNANNTIGNLVETQNGGFGFVMSDVTFHHAAQIGWKHTGNAVNVAAINCGFRVCVDGGVHFIRTTGASFNVVFSGNTQVDACGIDFFIFEDASTGSNADIAEIFIEQMKCEALESGGTLEAWADTLISLRSTTTNANGFRLVVGEIGCNRVGTGWTSQGDMVRVEANTNAADRASRVTILSAAAELMTNIFVDLERSITFPGTTSPDRPNTQECLAPFSSQGMMTSEGARFLDGITAPGTIAGFAQIYVDTADGDPKIKFGDGTVKKVIGEATETAISVTLDSEDGVVNVETTAAARIITLPDNAVFDGKQYLIRRDGANTVTIDRAGTDTFDDADIQKTLDSDSAAIGIFSIGDGEWKIVGTEGSVGGS